MTLPWREIERELEEWAREARGYKDRPVFHLDRNDGGDITADAANGYLFNLSSLARRLSDRLTLRLVEPATKSRDGAAEGTCPNCGYAVPKGEIHTCL